MTKLWGSRFKNKKTDSLADLFTFSIDYDQKLALYDVLGSMAHAKMLGKTGILSKKDASMIVNGLERIAKQITQGKFKYDKNAEDIHTNIQNALKKMIGHPADKLHTARSRNDQVVLDMKMYCLAEIDELTKIIAEAQKQAVLFAERNQDVIIPAYTHLRSAQVVLLAHHMLAYVEMFQRDKSRLLDARNRLNILPLGSCALSGTSLPIDREYVAQLLKFNGVSANSIDAVSDRDFVVEVIAALAITAMHLSRMAEDLIVWSTTEFGFIQIDWAYCTGSSIMPHKKNPDVLELIRGTTATVYGDLNTILNLLKGLPLTYNRDLQLDKPPLFESVRQTKLAASLMGKIFGSMAVNKAAVDAKINNEAFFTVDVMDYLIKKGVSYRQAHDTVGIMVKDCLDTGKSIRQLSLKQLKAYSTKFDNDVKILFNPNVSVKIKQSFGSTNPRLVKKQLAKWKKKLHA